ncbi:hypothetical protein [Glycomyces harbinensis]|uniref:Uncharacterized protein n=1 Tax=Glycomyces harbinensis TaxID=58114 RepID=A0A1G6Y088_9ACTN|nr:hypothetical protein [Glycomyces harbinensis]SDD83884.1 hypothetical protein SAMN05216270_10863 [Glycomyces harbinensis]
MDDPETTGPRGRRPVLVAAVVVGILTMCATFAGSVVNLLTGPAALAIAATGAVLAGMASIIATIVSGPAGESSERRAPASWNWLDVARHPLEAVRNIRLPLACALAVAAAMTTPEAIVAVIPLKGFAAAHAGVLLPVVTGAWALLIAMVAQGWNLTWDASEPRQKGAGLDALVTYTVAAGLGFWIGTITEPYLGLLIAAAAMFVLTAVAGRIEDDYYAKGPLPFALSAGAITATAFAAWHTGFGPFGTIFAGMSAIMAVTFPAAIRGKHPKFEAGILEFVPLMAFGLLGLDDRPWWFGVAVLVFAAGVVNSGGESRDAPDFKEGARFVTRWFGPLQTFAVLYVVLTPLAALYAAVAMAFPQTGWELP